jgi:Chaperone of endosialidase
VKNRDFIFTTILLTLGSFALPQRTQAVSPPPDGGYPGGNTAEGQAALSSLTTGGYNTAVGYLSLRSNATASFNTATGAGALAANLDADENTATGAGALLNNTRGGGNTANGAFALFSNTVGFFNTAVGDRALLANAGDVANSGDDDTAIGAQALTNNTVGGSNTASGTFALRQNTTGNDNTANGDSALESNTTGNSNVAVGRDALGLNNGNGNTAVGDSALVGIQTGNFNTALGENAGQHLDQSDTNNIDIGYNVLGVTGESNTIRIGNTDITDTFIRGISGATASGGAAVFVNGNGKLGTMTSSKRFKDQIKPMDRASEAILALRPVSFRYKKEIDPLRIPQFGLVAEEVEKVNPDLVIRDSQGKPQTVRYDQVNAMLLNEFLKEHRKVEKLEAALEAVNAHLEEQDSTIQKISDEAQLSRPAPRMVLGNP